MAPDTWVVLLLILFCVLWVMLCGFAVSAYKAGQLRGLDQARRAAASVGDLRTTIEIESLMEAALAKK